MSNNVKGIQASEKRLKLFEYFRKLSTHVGFAFRQETHSSLDGEKKWNDDFQDQLFFSHSKRNSCEAALGFWGRKSFELLNKFINKSGFVLIIEVKIENDLLLLINLYNAKTENEQVSTLSDLRKNIWCETKSMIIIIKAVYLGEI